MPTDPGFTRVAVIENLEASNDRARPTAGVPPERTAIDADFAQIYREHYAFVWRVLGRLGVPDARLEDAVQDVFLVVHRRLAEYVARGKITTWIYAIAMRMARKHCERALREETVHRHVTPRSEAPELDEIVQRKQALHLLDRLLARLSPAHREVFVLAEIEGLSAPEIAEITGVGVNTVYSRLRNGRLHFERAVTDWQKESA